MTHKKITKNKTGEQANSATKNEDGNDNKLELNEDETIAKKILIEKKMVKQILTRDEFDLCMKGVVGVPSREESREEWRQKSMEFLFETYPDEYKKYKKENKKADSQKELSKADIKLLHDSVVMVNLESGPTLGLKLHHNKANNMWDILCRMPNKEYHMFAKQEENFTKCKKESEIQQFFDQYNRNPPTKDEFKNKVCKVITEMNNGEIDNMAGGLPASSTVEEFKTLYHKAHIADIQDGRTSA